MEKLRIVFMGTPEFAVSILDTIIKNNYENLKDWFLENYGINIIVCSLK